MPQRKPELLVPAGQWPSLKAAVECGADSVYFGIKGINMRHSAANFELSELAGIMAHLHRHGRKGYLTLNTVLRNDDLPRAERILDEAVSAGVDAVILWDMAALEAARSRGLTIHVSTQASVANMQALEMYARLGAARVVLARECTLDQIGAMVARIRQRRLDCEIETFIHGAMCLSISGRCFMSAYTHGQSANQGKCTQPCRREYQIKAVRGNEEYVVGRDYVMSPRDLCSIDFLDRLVEAGIHSFKVEGRMRSPEYVRTVTTAYRRAIDACHAGEYTGQLKAGLMAELGKVYHRGFSSGFYFGEPGNGNSAGTEQTHEKVFLGVVRNYYRKIGVADIRIQNGSVRTGDELLFIGNSTPALSAQVGEIEKQKLRVESAVHGDNIGVKLPFAVKPKDRVFLYRRKAGA